MIIYAKEARQNVLKIVFFQQMWCWEDWTITCKSMNLEYFLILCTTINKWFKYLYLRHDSIKLLAQNLGKKFLGINHSNI